MSRNFNPYTERDPKRHVQWCQGQGCRVRETGSSHTIVTAENGVHASIPCGKELRRGTHHALLKAYVAMGLLAALGLLIWGWPTIQHYLIAA